MSVLQGVGNLFHNTVSGTSSLQDLASTVTELFLPTLQQEGELRPLTCQSALERERERGGGGEREGGVQGMGNLFHNTVSGTSSLQDLASTVTELFLPTLQQEGELRPLVDQLCSRSQP